MVAWVKEEQSKLVSRVHGCDVCILRKGHCNLLSKSLVSPLRWKSCKNFGTRELAGNRQSPNFFSDFGSRGRRRNGNWKTVSEEGDRQQAQGILGHQCESKFQSFNVDSSFFLARSRPPCVCTVTTQKYRRGHDLKRRGRDLDQIQDDMKLIADGKSVKFFGKAVGGPGLKFDDDLPGTTMC